MVHNIPDTESIAWRIPMGVQLIPAGLLAIGIPFLRESPVWLLKKDRFEKAVQVYSYYRNLATDHEYVLQDIAFVRGQIEHERAVSAGGQAGFAAFIRGAARESVMKGMRNRFALVFIMFMWQAWSGAAAINYYSPTIFTSIGLGKDSHVVRDATNMLTHRRGLHSLDWNLWHHQGRRFNTVLLFLHR